MKITYYGHSCFLAEVSGSKLLFDPFIRENQLAKDIDVNSIEADYILLSHGHFDHTSDALEISKRTGAAIVANFEVATWFEKMGAKKIHPMNHGGKWKFKFGTVKFVSAVHSSSMPDGAYGGHAGGFVVTTDEGSFYYSGDTGLTMDMQLIPMLCGDLKVTMLPIGDNFTMGLDEAIVASDFIKCDKVIGLHYDTFGFIKIDHEEAKKKFQTKGKDLILLEIGKSIEL